MGAASISPVRWEGDFGVRTLLQQQFTLRVEQKDTEGAVQHALLDIRHQVR